LSFLAWTPAFAEEDLRRAVLDVNLYDFGTVLRGAKVEMAIGIANQGDTQLSIAGVTTSMSGMKTKAPRVIQPGHTTKLLLELDTATYLDEVEGNVVILFNDPQSPELKVDIKGHVESHIDLQPTPPVFLQAFRWDAAKTKRVLSVENRDEKPLNMVGLETEGDQFLAKLSTLEEGKRYQISVKLNPNAAPGRAVNSITLITDRERIQFPVFTFLKEKVYTFPPALHFPPIHLEDVQENPEILKFREESLFIYQFNGTDFQIEIHSVPEYISVEKVPESGAGSVIDIPNQGRTAVFELIFSLNREYLKQGSFQDKITIITNDPEFSELRIPVSLEVK